MDRDQNDSVGWHCGVFVMHYKLPLVFEPQPEGGYTVTSPLLPELITEGDTVEDALENVRDALAAVLELYQEDGRALPPNLVISEEGTVRAAVRRLGLDWDEFKQA